MQYQGVLQKMQTDLQDTIQYYMVFDNDVLNVNQLLGKSYLFLLKNTSV